jgi:anaerobic selenocysteine-containing dehydrogenase
MALSRPGQERDCVKTCCCICGHNQCGVQVRLEDGAVKEILGDPDDPVTEGAVCPKALASVQLLTHPGRLRTPLVRAGERGEGKWREATWDEALAIVAGRLNDFKRESGPESVVMARGTNRGSWIRVFNRFANLFGTPNWTESGGAQCFTPRSIAQSLTFGGLALEWPDFANSECILVWGANPPATWPPKSKKLMAAKKRGAKLIVIDPVQSNIAAKADLWLPVRPGSDAALALGMLHVILGETLYDREYVESHCLGLAELGERVREYTPARVAEITWVEERLIVEAARVFAKSKPACIEIACTLDEVIDPIQLSRAVALLASVTGNIDVAGGNIFPHAAGQVSIDTNDFILRERLAHEVQEKRLGAEAYPLLSKNLPVNFPMAHWPAILEAILTGKPYTVRAIFLMGGNPALSIAKSRRAKEALRKVEFLAVADLFMSKTAELADVVLPASSWLEQNGLADSSQASFGPLRIRRKVASVGKAVSDIEIMCRLAAKLDLPDFWKSEADYLNYIVKPLNLTFDELQARGESVPSPMIYGKHLREGFRTPSGKIELFSHLLEDWGYDPLPFYREPHESPYSTPELAKQYPFVMTTGRRVITYFHTGLRNVPALRDVKPVPVLDINASTARSLRIEDGDQVTVESPYGRVTLVARLTEGIHPRVVGVPHGWPDEANDNLLMNNEVCSLGIGTTPLRGTLCSVRRAER